MSYEKQTWEDFPSENSVMNKDKMNHIENGISDLDEEIQDLSSEGFDMKKETSGSTIGTYTLLARYTMPLAYSDLTDVIVFNANYTGYADTCILSVSLRRDPNETFVDFSKYLSSNKLNKTDFYTVTNYDFNSGTRIVDLYVHIHADFTVIYGKSLTKHYSDGCIYEYFIDQPNLIELPSGAQYQIKNYEISNLQLVGDYFGQVDLNQVKKSGNTVQIMFRGYVKNTIPNNTNILNTPFPTSNQLEIDAIIGGQYNISNRIFAYLADYNQIKTSEVQTGQWLHINQTYVCD